MIGQQLLNTLRSGICAIGYTTVPVGTYLQNASAPYLKVLGTGFLIRNEVVITCRHVIQALLEAQEELGFPDDQRVLVFITPNNGAGVNIGVSTLGTFGFPTNSDIDVAFVECPRLEGPGFVLVKALPLRRAWDLRVTQQVAVCGYPYGHAMLQRNRRVYRWGPVVQQGYVSALSPFDNLGGPQEMLLDVRVAGGMSGAPIFLPDDAVVIGILTSAWEATTAVGIPVTEELATQWLTQFDEFKRAQQPSSPETSQQLPRPS
jgi:V8-like Glu-specific endopeptidase